MALLELSSRDNSRASFANSPVKSLSNFGSPSKLSGTFSDTFNTSSRSSIRSFNGKMRPSTYGSGMVGRPIFGQRHDQVVVLVDATREPGVGLDADSKTIGDLHRELLAHSVADATSPVMVPANTCSRPTAATAGNSAV